jgi:hypothetical protein
VKKKGGKRKEIPIAETCNAKNLTFLMLCLITISL